MSRSVSAAGPIGIIYSTLGNCLLLSTILAIFFASEEHMPYIIANELLNFLSRFCGYKSEVSRFTDERLH